VSEKNKTGKASLVAHVQNIIEVSCTVRGHNEMSSVWADEMSRSYGVFSKIWNRLFMQLSEVTGMNGPLMKRKVHPN
jgi:hypothetical protein